MNGQLAPNMHNKSGLSLVLASFHYQSDQRWHMPINCINVVTCLKQCSYMLGTVLSWFHSSFILVSSRYCSRAYTPQSCQKRRKGQHKGHHGCQQPPSKPSSGAVIPSLGDSNNQLIHTYKYKHAHRDTHTHLVASISLCQAQPF